MLTFSAVLPEKVCGVPSQRDCARVLGDKGTDGAALLYRCGKSIFGQAL